MDSILIAEQRSENSEFQKGVDFFFNSDYCTYMMSFRVHFLSLAYVTPFQISSSSSQSLSL